MKKGAPAKGSFGTVTQDGTGNQQTVALAPITQGNSGGCNQQVIGGNNNTNNCAPQPISISALQVLLIAKALRTAKASHEITVRISHELDVEDGANIADSIAEAFRNAGIETREELPAMMSTNACAGGQRLAGISVDCIDAINRPLANAFSYSLMQSGVIKSPPYGSEKPEWVESHDLLITIRKP